MTGSNTIEASRGPRIQEAMIETALSPILAIARLQTIALPYLAGNEAGEVVSNQRLELPRPLLQPVFEMLVSNG